MLQSPLLNFTQKNPKFLQILQLAICQLICNMYDLKYFVILVPASYVNVSENYDLHFAFYIITLLKFISFFKLV
jgi:hypothetical protein